MKEVHKEELLERGLADSPLLDSLRYFACIFQHVGGI